MDVQEFMSKLCVWGLILGVVGVCAQADSTSRACIIGAGSSGLSTARFMKEYGVNFTVFEATRYIGGIWRYNPNIGTDEDGWPTFISVYKNMRINGVIELMAFRDFPFPKGLPSFISATCYYKYLQSFTNHFDLMKYIQFQSRITGIQRSGDKWDVTYIKTDTKTYVTEKCDFVVVASGEFNKPNIPHFEKQEDFNGKIMHSMDYRDAELFRDQRVLIVGAGSSALDFVTQLINVTSTLLHSHHFIFKLPEVPGNYVRKPDIKHFTPTGAVFVDNSTEEFDVAILCTGYTYDLPFLNYKSTGVTATSRYVMPLYNQVVNINNPSMTFVGIGKSGIPSVHETQSQYAAALAAGEFKLPSQDHMFEHWFNHTKNLDLTHINDIEYLNTDAYLEELLQDVDLPRPRPPPVYVKIIENELVVAYKTFLNYRDYQYKILNYTDYVKTYKPMKEVCTIDV